MDIFLSILIQTVISIMIVYYAQTRPKRKKQNEAANFFENHYDGLIQMLKQKTENEPPEARIALCQLQLNHLIPSLRILISNHSVWLDSKVFESEDTTFNRLSLAIHTFNQNSSLITLKSIVEILDERRSFWKYQKRHIVPF